MSLYTTQVRFICESLVDDATKPIDEIIDVAAPKLFPIGENYQTSKPFGRNIIPWEFVDAPTTYAICRKILGHYYTREIGWETAGLWVFHMNEQLAEIAPYYTQLVKATFNSVRGLTAEDIENLYGDTDLKRLFTGDYNDKNDGNSTNKNTTTADNYNLDSDTPQNGLVSIKPAQDSAGMAYLSYARRAIIDQINNNDETRSDTSVRKADTTETVKGKSGGKAKIELMRDVAKNLINIENRLISELSTEFLNLW